MSITRRSRPWGGKGIGIYGGINDVVTNNLLQDTARYFGLGVMKFGVNGSDLLSATVIGNTVLRCGGNGYNQQQQAMMIGNGGDGQSVGTVQTPMSLQTPSLMPCMTALVFRPARTLFFNTTPSSIPDMMGLPWDHPAWGWASSATPSSIPIRCRTEFWTSDANQRRQRLRSHCSGGRLQL